MANLIKNEKIEKNSWLLLKLTADGGLPVIPAAGDILVPLSLWQAGASELLARSTGRVGVWLDSDQDPALIADSLEALSLIAVNFPQFTDGRGYSIARLLRDRYGWTGELRAIGDIQRDQLFYLSRCGFNAFDLVAGQDEKSALSAFADFTHAYQKTAIKRSSAGSKTS